MKIFKEPLLHFLLAGLALFVVYYQLNPDEQGAANVIAVNEDSLLTFIQYRTKSFEPKLAQQRWAKMTGLEQQSLVDEYIKEEVLYREAMALDLQQDDYIIKRRLVQKVDFILQTDSEQLTAADDEALQVYMDKNPADYWVEPFITFTHVYFNQAGSSQAGETLAKLNQSKVAFASAAEYGERFLYHLNYVERTKAYIEAHFGKEFAEQAFTVADVNINSGVWLGPFASQHGQHLLLISKRQAGYQPALAEIRGRVAQDYLRYQQLQSKDKKLQTLMGKYQVERDEQWLQTEGKQ